MRLSKTDSSQGSVRSGWRGAVSAWMPKVFPGQCHVVDMITHDMAFV